MNQHYLQHLCKVRQSCSRIITHQRSSCIIGAWIAQISNMYFLVTVGTLHFTVFFMSSLSTSKKTSVLVTKSDGLTPFDSWRWYAIMTWFMFARDGKMFLKHPICQTTLLKKLFSFESRCPQGSYRSKFPNKLRIVLKEVVLRNESLWKSFKESPSMLRNQTVKIKHAFPCMVWGHYKVHEIFFSL